MNIFKQYYQNIVKYDLLTKFKHKNINQIPKLEKIIIYFKTKNINFKLLITGILSLEFLTLQKFFIIKSRTSNISLKIRYGNPIGCKITLRKSLMFLLLIKMFSEIFPTFYKPLKLSFISKKTFTFTLEKIFLFPEIENQYKIFNCLTNFKIIIVTTSTSFYELFFLLKSFKFPINLIKFG